MIFKQYAEVLLGEKTLTTRIRLPAHIRDGATWAIVPGRAKPAWWIPELGIPGIVINPREYASEYGLFFGGSNLPLQAILASLRETGYVQARIRIERFWQTPLQQMTEAEAQQEGVASVEQYAALWGSINDRKGARWSDNPAVWRIRFSLPQDVCVAVSRVGRAAIFAAAGTPYKAARGALVWTPGDEPAEATVRRIRGGEA